MPRRSKKEEEPVEEELVEEEPEEVEEDDEEEEDEEDGELSEDDEGEEKVEEDDAMEDPIEDQDEDELDSEEQAMTVAQHMLMRKKQEVLSQSDVYRKYYTEVKTTAPYITKFERAKILSVRAQAIENGATPFVPIDDPDEDPYSIAKREYDARRIPYFVVRMLPNHEKEYWRLSDFKSLVPLTSM